MKEENPSTPQMGEDNPHAKTKYHVLVVDDEEEILQYLKHELSTDFHVAGCNNGKEALSMLLNVKFDLVISDVMMPVMDGEALCRKIRQNINLNHLPAILLTANTEEEAMISGLDTGADEYMVKPVSMNLLRTRVYNLIHGRERLYNNFAGKQIEESKLEELHVKTPDEQLMERIMREVNNNLSNPELTVEMLADKVGMSRVHLNRKLKELTNQTARDFIRNIRLKQAATLLEQGNHQVNRIAELVGFTNVSNFTTAFHNLYGVAPKDYPHREG
jgi:YesN/AraC family two-component response regulator